MENVEYFIVAKNQIDGTETGVEYVELPTDCIFTCESRFRAAVECENFLTKRSNNNNKKHKQL